MAEEKREMMKEPSPGLPRHRAKRKNAQSLPREEAERSDKRLTKERLQKM